MRMLDPLQAQKSVEKCRKLLKIPEDTQPRPDPVSQHHAGAHRTEQADASDTICRRLRQPDDVGSSTGQHHMQQETLSAPQAQEHHASLFADMATRALAKNSGNLTKIAEDHADRLKHHCLICDHWVVDLNTVKTHILRSHPVAWHKCNPTISQGHGVFAKALKRDNACPCCGKVVFGTARHLTQCPVIVQVALLHQLAVLEVDPYDVQSKPVHINTAQAARLLTNY